MKSLWKDPRNDLWMKLIDIVNTRFGELNFIITVRLRNKIDISSWDSFEFRQDIII